MDIVLSFVAIAVALTIPCAVSAAAVPLPSDTLSTPDGDLSITFVGHGTLILSHAGRVVHVDPWGNLADYSTLPKADLILVTHEHRDHLDTAAIAAIRKGSTVVLANAASAAQVPGAEAVANGERRVAAGIAVDAVPAYNLVHMRSPGTPYHPKGQGNGYVLTLGGLRVYVAGDTENVPEMGSLGRVDVAFLPVNLPYTMTPAMFVEAARLVRPAVLYPYHTGETEMDRLAQLLREVPGIELRVRPMR